MNLTNAKMEQMLESAQRHLDKADIIGYACARNVRMLSEELTEYQTAMERLCRKYGEDERDSDGNATGRLIVRRDIGEWGEFEEKMAEFGGIEHEFKPFVIPYDKAIGILSGTELLELDWMFEEE